jgi:hypothetical protein
MFAALIALSCLDRAALAGEIYKSVDAQGHAVYSDRASTSTAKKSSVEVEQPDPAEVARIAKQQELLQAQDIQRAQQQRTDDRRKSQEQLARHAQCADARNRYFHIRDLRRIYVTDDAGNRVYKSDAEGDALKEEARRTMVAACGT